MSSSADGTTWVNASEALHSGRVWIFGYGSLIFRPSFRYLERRRAFVDGWARRFWQGSPDHRGVPEAPGRVVTLVRDAGTCGGCAYRIDPAEADAIFAALDVREQAGFERHHLPMHDDATLATEPFAHGHTWIANETNAHFLGPLPEDAIAAWVRERRGPSGPNSEYVRRLARALEELAIADAHVAEIVRHLGPDEG